LEYIFTIFHPPKHIVPDAFLGTPNHMCNEIRKETQLSYPLSSPVTSGQPTAADHYNNLRSDALYLGSSSANARTLAGFLNRHAEHMSLEVLNSTRLRVPYSINKPPTLMINGYMLQAAANVDLAASQFSGAAATWYVFAVRSAESATFTLAVNTSSAESTDQRLIGECVWNGSALSSVTCYLAPSAQLSTADYDSGWFAVAYGNTYTKAHGLGLTPRLVMLFWSSSSTGASENIPVYTVTYASNPDACYGFDSTNCYVTCGDSSSSGTIRSTRANSSSGYYRLLAWK
jgi:hypothetical protein